MKYNKHQLEESIKKMQEVYDKEGTSDSVKQALEGPLKKAKALLKELDEAEEKKEPEQKPAPAEIKKAVGKASKKLKKVKPIVAKAKQVAAKKKAKKTVEPKMTVTQKKTLRDIVAAAAKYAGYRGKSERELQADSRRKAKPLGKRTSKSGKSYREYRLNRADIDRGAPHLAKGGRLKEAKVEEFESVYDGKVQAYHSLIQDDLYFYVIPATKTNKYQYYKLMMEHKGEHATSIMGTYYTDREEPMKLAKRLAEGKAKIKFERGGTMIAKGGKALKSVTVPEKNIQYTKRHKAAGGPLKEAELVQNFQSMHDGIVDAYKSTTEDHIYYYVSSISDFAHSVIIENKGQYATEAMDDWFANLEDAKEAAKALAEGWAGGMTFKKGGKAMKAVTEPEKKIQYTKRHKAEGGPLEEGSKAKIMLEYIGKDVSQDNYKEGEIPGTRSTIMHETIMKQFDSLKFLFAFLGKSFGLSENPAEYTATDHGVLIYARTENANGDMPTELEMTKFEKGKINLYTADYWIKISYANLIPIPKDDLVEIGTDQYELGGSIEDDDEPEMDEDEVRDEPDYENDSFIQSNGWEYSVSFGGKYLGTVSEMSEALDLIAEAQEKSNYFPTLWFVSDHGNAWPIDKEGNEIKHKGGPPTLTVNESTHIATPETQMTVCGYETINFTTAAFVSFSHAVTALNNETNKEGAYYQKAKKAMKDLAIACDELLDPTNDDSAEAHYLLQRVGMLNYQTGNLVNTDFLNSNLSERNLEEGGEMDRDNIEQGDSDDEMKKGGRLKSGLMRDRAYRSNEPHELRYHRRIRPTNPRYNYGKGGVTHTGDSKKRRSDISVALFWLAAARKDMPTWSIGFQETGKLAGQLKKNPWDQHASNMIALYLKNYANENAPAKNKKSILESADKIAITGTYNSYDVTVDYRGSGNPKTKNYTEEALSLDEAVLQAEFKVRKLKGFEKIDGASARLIQKAKRGRVLSGLNRDRAYKSNEPWEKRYHRKTRPANPRYSTFETGGMLKNGYKRKRPREIWNSWNDDQRKHFLSDHVNMPKSSINNMAVRSFDGLDPAIKDVLKEHVAEGQYAKGGSVKKKFGGYKPGKIVGKIKYPRTMKSEFDTYRLYLITKDFVYYAMIDDDAVLMFNKKMMLVSDNFLAENDLTEVLQKDEDIEWKSSECKENQKLMREAEENNE